MKIIKYIVLIVFLLGTVASCETLKGGVSKVDLVPNSFYGTWRVVAKIDSQSSNGIYFKPNTVDIWNLSRVGNVINLNNPFTGASASVTVDYVDGNLIKFTKTGEYDNKKLTDTVNLKLSGNTFTGINSLSLETYSNVDNTLIKKDTALYVLRGEKISGVNILGKE